MIDTVFVLVMAAIVGTALWGFALFVLRSIRAYADAMRR